MNRQILKNACACLLFLLILVFVMSSVTWLYRGNKIESREDIRGFKSHGDADVVLVGGSTLLRYYDPLQAWNRAGITSYNYATSSARFDVLRDYIEDSRKTARADLYVINVRTISLMDAAVDDASIRNWSDSLDPLSITRLRGIGDYLSNREWDPASLPSFVFDIIKYHSNSGAPGDSAQWAYVGGGKIYNADRGFSPNAVCVPFDKKTWGDGRSALSDQQSAALSGMLDYCDSKKLKALFVCCPFIFTEYDEGILNTCGDIIRDRGYEFVNFNEHIDEIGLDFTTDFSDINHVNYSGAVKYTDYLTDYIKDRFELTDHRGDPAYDRWTEDYEALQPAMKEMAANLAVKTSRQENARKIGSTLKGITDFYEWYAGIRNRGFTVIIRMNTVPSGLSVKSPMYLFMSEYKVDPEKETYIGIWNYDKALVSTSKRLNAKAKIGVDGGRGTDACKVSVESGFIRIAGVDYTADKSPIQVVVYDSNYKEVVDNVNLVPGDGDAVEILR
ncbi:MAG: hypothetical protein Q4G47_02275 [Lachnospiraceae bacterium]|nr:hypothetical protein [Lachnospiraceae bacterium]